MTIPEELEPVLEKIVVFVLAEPSENIHEEQRFNLEVIEGSITLLEERGTIKFFKNYQIDQLDDAIAYILQRIKRYPRMIIGKAEFPTVRLFTKDNTVFTPTHVSYNATKAIMRGTVLIGAVEGELKSEPPFRLEMEELPRLEPFHRMLALTNKVAKALSVDVPELINLRLEPIGSSSSPCFTVTD